jgi:hypothetical protein
MESLTQVEKELLKRLNTRALLIVEIEEALKERKIPIDPNLLHTLETEKLVELLETWAGDRPEKLANKFKKIETLAHIVHTIMGLKAEVR